MTETMTLDRKQIEAKIITKALEDPAFMQELLNNPTAAKTAVEAELGQQLPATFEYKVLQETDEVAYLLLPTVVEDGQELSDGQLEAIAGGGKCMFISIELPCMLGSFCPFSSGL